MENGFRVDPSIPLTTDPFRATVRADLFSTTLDLNAADAGRTKKARQSLERLCGPFCGWENGIQEMSPNLFDNSVFAAK
jgi:hypothetical protein